MRLELGAALLGGAAAGVVGYAAFLVIHAVWIVPIWDAAPGGFPFAVFAGVAVGWAYDVYHMRLPARPIRRAAGVFACASFALAPGLLLLPLPPPDPGGSNPSIIVVGVAGIAVFLLLAMPLIAATLGAVFGRSLRAAVAIALAAFTLIISLGHNIPTFGFGWHGVKMWTIMLTVNAIAAVTLIVVDTWISRRLRPNPGSSEAASRATR
jgi:hypothetical protein